MNPALSGFPTWMGGNIPTPPQPGLATKVFPQTAQKFGSGNVARMFNVGAKTAMPSAMGTLGRVASGPAGVITGVVVPAAKLTEERMETTGQAIPTGIATSTRPVNENTPLNAPISTMSISSRPQTFNLPNTMKGALRQPDVPAPVKEKPIAPFPMGGYNEALAKFKDVNSKEQPIGYASAPSGPTMVGNPLRHITPQVNLGAPPSQMGVSKDQFGNYRTAKNDWSEGSANMRALEVADKYKGEVASATRNNSPEMALREAMNESTRPWWAGGNQAQRAGALQRFNALSTMADRTTKRKESENLLEGHMHAADKGYLAAKEKGALEKTKLGADLGLQRAKLLMSAMGKDQNKGGGLETQAKLLNELYKTKGGLVDEQDKVKIDALIKHYGLTAPEAFDKVVLNKYNALGEIGQTNNGE